MPGCPRKLEINGEIMNLKQAAEKYGRVCYSTIRCRVSAIQKYSIIDALTRPLDCTYVRLEGVVDRIKWWMSCGVAYDVNCYRDWYFEQSVRHNRYKPGEQVSDYLTIIRKVEINRRTFWLCQCKCGNKTTVITGSLASGATVSCGCRRLEYIFTGDNSKTHGLSKHPFYGNYRNILKRCSDPTSRDFPSYGGRGITVCEEWSNEESGLQTFLNWVDSQDNYADNLTIERINVNGNYCPENCCLIPLKEQVYNRRDSYFVWLNGEKMHIYKAAQVLSPEIGGPLVKSRLISRGWSVADAFKWPKGAVWVPLERVKRNLNGFIARHLKSGNLNLIEGLVPASERWLTDDEVRDVLYRYKTLRESSKSLALEFGVNQKTITNIANGFTRRRATEHMLNARV